MSPGLYYTPRAIESRNLARHFVVRLDPAELAFRDRGAFSSDYDVIFDPYGKGMMVQGGVGCLRLEKKDIGGEKVKFLCATESGVAHQGFIVAMPKSMYDGVTDLIHTRGNAIYDIEGKIQYWPSRLPLYSLGIDRTYLYVERLREIALKDDANLDVTAAITFEGNFEDRRGAFFTYSHFDPSRHESIDKCVDWLRVNYVEGRYHGRVLTDFDEVITHFADAEFPAKVLMNPQLPPQYISKICEGKFGTPLTDGI